LRNGWEKRQFLALRFCRSRQKGSALKTLAEGLYTHGGDCTLSVGREVKMEIPAKTEIPDQSSHMKSQRKQLITIALACLLGLAGCSGGGTGIFVLPPPPPERQFLYATSAGHILAFTLDQSSGALGAPVTIAGPNQSTGMTATVTLGHLYVSDFLNDAVDGFSINSSTGTLTAVTGSPFSLPGTPPGAGGLTTIVSGGSYLYATDINAGTVAGFNFVSPTGKLTPVPGSPFPAGDTPVQAAQAGIGNQFLYVSNLNDSAGGISGFSIDPSTGTLSPIPGSPFPAGLPGSFPGPSALISNGNFLYVALVGTTSANNKIAAFAIDPSSGTLTAVPGSPFATGRDPLYMAFVPVTLVGLQAFLYTANVQDDTISAFTANDNTGVLTPVSGSPYAAGTSVGGLATAVQGSFFLYAADPQAKTVTAYTYDGNTGALSPLPGSPFPAGNAPTLLTVAQVP
jgi:6-phosphogluconolactonase